ncbi:MAG: hypothetical protein AMJ62_04860 [Myxococcales bacterium SG8_38]|nr:MAG: hypothetical protein AMJ62_04860 [Myxococcales bacterium SG8_38]
MSRRGTRCLREASSRFGCLAYRSAKCCFPGRPSACTSRTASSACGLRPFHATPDTSRCLRRSIAAGEHSAPRSYRRCD